LITQSKIINFESSVFHIQRSDKSDDEYEDAYSISDDNLIFALADGTSDSIYQKELATMLVSEFVSNPICLDGMKDKFVKWLEPIQKRWQELIDWEKLPYYKEAKAKIGAFSTLLAVRVTTHQTRSIVCLATTTHQTRSIVCLAVGDTCMFVVSKDGFVSFPVSSTADFNNNPYLLGSYSKYNIQLKQHIQTTRVAVDDGDLIVMATDAFSNWFLTELQKGEKPWTRFENLDQGGFNGLIQSLRNSKDIRDDDTTAIFIAVRT